MDNAWRERRVLAYAHQGGALEAPSSTLFAIERAIELGATGIELDVHATADRRLVVSHDATVDRTTNGHGLIAQMTLAELQGLDNAYWFVPGENAVHGRDAADYPYRGRRARDDRFAIPTLEDVLARTSGVALNLDLKSTPGVVLSEDLLAFALADSGELSNVIVTSFDDHVTDRFARLSPTVATSPGVSEITAFVQAVRAGSTIDARIARHAALQVPATFGGAWLVDEGFVAAAHELDLAVHVWTVDDEDAMRYLLDCEVDAIMTDRPSILVDLLSRLGIGLPTSEHRKS